MGETRFPLLVKMAMTRYGLKEDDIRRALLNLPGVNGNSHALLANFDRYKGYLSSIKEIFGSYLVFDEKQVDKIEKLEHLRDYFETFFPGIPDNTMNHMFKLFTDALLSSDKNERNARVSSFIITDIWEQHNNRDSDLKSFINMLKKDFDVQMVDYPFTKFTKQFGAMAPSSYENLPYTMVLADLIKTNALKSVIDLHDRIDQPLQKIRSIINRQPMVKASDQLVGLCVSLYEGMMHEIAAGRTEHVPALKVILYELLKAFDLRDHISGLLNNYPALKSLIKTGRLTDETAKKSENLFTTAIAKLGAQLEAIKAASYYAEKDIGVKRFGEIYTNLYKSSRGQGHVREYLVKYLTSLVQLSGDDEVAFAMLYHSGSFKFFAEALHRRIHNPAGIALIRKWGYWIAAKTSGKTQDALRLLLTNSVMEPNYGIDSPVFGPMLILLVVKGMEYERVARDYLKSLPVPGSVLVKEIMNNTTSPVYAKQVEQFILKTKGPR